jgi:hypothetical protein
LGLTIKSGKQVTVIDSTQKEAFRCHPGLARLMLKRNLAKVVQSEPYTIIQLTVQEAEISGLFPLSSEDVQ